jgi:hypothetical protein
MFYSCIEFKETLTPDSICLKMIWLRRPGWRHETLDFKIFKFSL